MANKLNIGISLGSCKGLMLKSAMEQCLKLSNNFDLNTIEIRFGKELGKPSLWYWDASYNFIKFLENFEIIGAHLPFIDLNPVSYNPKIRKESKNQLKNAIAKASILGMNYAVMHTRGLTHGLTNEQQINEWDNVIKELADYADDNSIILTIENADFFSNLIQLVASVRRVNSKYLRITFDVGHAHIRCVPPLQSYPIKELGLRVLDIFFPFFFKKGMPYEEYGSASNFIKSEHDLLSVVHIHDYDGNKDHLAIGEGKIDFSFLMELKKFFRGPYIFEVGLENYHADFEKNYKIFKEFIEL